ncbi:LIM domain-containing protein [Diaporthe amygdali]|uniref:LIM domain-containing protein n=1 Tax=Phomopsis amygdali TaxID=1214568 RepID=UPI0022FDCEE5|nr:LIM domain-containing protein [Diaporthe amygdali]KAJ0119369.1 LIM domain-containing protein [Diaporthe amygdali]
MGDHICGGGAGGGASGGANSIDAFTPLYKGIHDKISVPPVDTAMASPSSASLYPSPLQSTDIHSTDRSYSRQPLTPLSFSSGSRSVSPRTPGARPSIGRADDYFAPSIASDDQNPSQTRRSGGYGGFGDTELYPAYAPASPQKKAPSLLNRMDDIAPGPFGSGQSASPPRNRFGGSPPRRPYDEVERPGTSASSGSNGAGSMGPPRVPRKNGYGGFGPPQRDDQDTDSFGGPNRSKTFPRPSEELEPPLRTPSAPGPRPDRYDKYRNPSTDMSVRMGPVTTRAPPPRTSLVRPPTSGGNAPSINLAEEFGDMNPYHSPSVSVSSSLSQGSSQPSYPSSSTSPARSTASARKPSNTSGFDNLMSDIQASMDELSPREMNQSGSPERRQAPMNDERYDPAIQGGRTPSPPSSSLEHLSIDANRLFGAHEETARDVVMPLWASLFPALTDDYLAVTIKRASYAQNAGSLSRRRNSTCMRISRTANATITRSMAVFADHAGMALKDSTSKMKAPRSTTYNSILRERRVQAAAAPDIQKKPLDELATELWERISTVSAHAQNGEEEDKARNDVSALEAAHR